MNKKEYLKQYYLINKQRISKLKAEWYKKNRSRLRDKDREYKQNNKDIINKKRKLYPSYNKKPYPHKDKARSLLNTALKSGKVIKLPCEVCQNPKSQAHHEDHNKPLEVIWLCSIHHGLRHRKTITN